MVASEPPTASSQMARAFAPHAMPAWRRWLLAICLLPAFSCAHAALRAHAQTLQLPGVELADVSIDASLGADGRPQLTLQAARVDVPALGWHGVEVDLRGQPQQAAGAAWKFTGHVATQRAPGGALSDSDLIIVYDPDGGTLEVDVAQARTGVHALLPLDQPSDVQLKLTALPLYTMRRYPTVPPVLLEYTRFTIRRPSTS